MECVCGPACVRGLVVPIGKWKSIAFKEKLNHLKSSFEVRLLDITPLPDVNFNPQKFPQGRLFFRLESAVMDDSDMLFLHDFEPYRKTFIVIGLCNDKSDPSENLAKLKQRFGSAICHNLIYTKYIETVHDNVFNYTTSIETIMCDIGRDFLDSLSNYYRSYKHVTLRSPGAIGGDSVLKTTFVRQPSIILKRSTSSPLDTTKANIKRTNSLKGLTLTNSDKNHQKSKARQLKILANFQLLAGQYIDSLSNFSESAMISYKVNDYLWLGNSLEGISICMLLLTYLEIPFQIPPIITLLCTLQTSNTQPSSRRTSMNLTPYSSPRNSMAFSGSLSGIDSHEANLCRLIKNITDKVLYYYDLSLSSTVEYTPQLVYCETILRSLTFMTMCYLGGDLTVPILRSIIHGISLDKIINLDISVSEEYTKWEVYQFSNKLFELQLSEFDIFCQLRIYNALGFIYEKLGFRRKRAFILSKFFFSILPRLKVLPWLPQYNDLVDCILNTYQIDTWNPETMIKDASGYNWVSLQKSVLISLVRIMKKAGDCNSVVKYSTWLLSKFSHVLTKVEQQSLLNESILPNIKTFKVEYWDPFLLRKIELRRLNTEIEIPEKIFIGTISNIDETTNNEQIFNPFKDQIAITQDHGSDENSKFMVGETLEYICTLQNPFHFNLEITSLSLNDSDSKYIKFIKNDITPKTPVIVEAQSIKSISLIAVLLKHTDRVHMLKYLNIGLFDLYPKKFPLVMTESLVSFKENKYNERSNLGSVKMEILSKQPQLELISTSLNNNSCMLLHGTKKPFNITLRNKSFTNSITYLKIMHITNIELHIHDDYWKNLAPNDVYKAEYQIKWLQDNCIDVLNIPKTISPNETFTIDLVLNVSRAPFDFNKFDITIEYGILESEEVALVKKLTIPFKITLKRTIEISNMTIIPLHETFSSGTHLDWVKYIMTCINNDQILISDYVLMLLDIRNSWVKEATVQLEFEEFKTDIYGIESGHTKRIIIPIKKIEFSENYHDKPIPKVFKSRQFIYNTSTQDQIHEMRREFWCREYILSRLKCHWKIINSPLQGIVDFHQYLNKFDDRIVSLINPGKDAYKIELKTTTPNPIIGEFFKLTAKVLTNHDNESYVTLQFHIIDIYTGVSLSKSNKKILYNGTLTKTIKLKKDFQAELDILPIERGKYGFYCEINNISSDILHCDVK